MEELKSHSCLLLFDAEGRPRKSWPLLDGEAVDVRGVLACNEPEVLRQAALDGAGIALLPLDIVNEAIANHELVQVLRDQVGARVGLYLVYPAKEYIPPQVRAFADLALQRLSEPTDPT